MSEPLPAKPYAGRLATLTTIRQEHEADWRDISAYVLPRKGLFADQGDKANDTRNHSRIIDPFGTQSLKYLAAGMQGGMTSQSRPWCRLSLRDDSLMEYDPVRYWMNLATEELRNVLLWSNFYQGTFNLYKETIGFGGGCMLSEEDINMLVRFSTFTCGEYYLAVNEYGVVDTFYRRIQKTARNLVSQFGEQNCSEPVRQAAKKDDQQDKYFDVCHAIQPNKKREHGKADSANKAFESVYWEDKHHQKLLSRRGYDEFPIFAPRWDTVSTTSIYGEGPARDQLGNIKQLQEMAKGEIKAIHLENEPPMRIPPQYKGRLSLLPGAQNEDPTLTQGGSGQGIQQLFEFRHDYAGVGSKIERLYSQISQGFYNDLFRMLIDRPGMQPPTAREVAERHEEKIIMLSPVLERFNTEFFNPMIKRVFNIMIRNQYLPPPPAEIQGQEMKVEYISTLAQAQKLIGLQSIDTFLGFISGAAGIFPDVVDKVDPDELVDQYAESTGVPPKIVRSDDVVAEIRQGRAQAEQQQQAMAEMGAGADVAQTLSQTDTGGENALAELTAAMTGA